jgi:restriction endonuclease S subunit
MLLKDVADISTGLVIQRKIANHPNDIKKSYRLLTLKSLEDDGWVNDEYLDNFDSNEILDEKYLTSIGDILIRLSAPYTCIPIENEKDAGLVVPSQFAVIRLIKDIVNSGYLAFALNSDLIKERYIRTSLGATIPVIRVGTLKNTEIHLPPLSSQETISHIRSLQVKKKQLQYKLNFFEEEKNKQIERKIMEGIEHGN